MKNRTVRLQAPVNLLVKQKGEKYLVFNPNVPAWLVTNAAGAGILQLCDGTRSSSEIKRLLPANTAMTEAGIEQFLTEAVDKKLFVKTRTIYAAPHFPLRSVYFNITEDCNLRCRYCYAEERNKTEAWLTLADYQRIIREIRDLSPEVCITFTGGEPLLSPRLMEVAAYAKNMTMRTFLLTNGTLITRDNVRDIAGLFDDIKISLDGSQASVNDQTRGAGTFDRVMQALGHLDSIGKNYRLSMTVTRKNIHDVGAMGARFGGKLNYAPYFQRSSVQINQDLAITGREYYLALREAASINPYGEVGALIRANINKRVIQKCSIADGNISIAANGDVFPCQLLHFAEFKAGNLLDASLAEIYTNSSVLLKLRELTVDKIDGCDDCPISLMCGGGCVARNFYENGKIDCAGDFCDYEQLALLDSLIDQYDL